MIFCFQRHLQVVKKSVTKYFLSPISDRVLKGLFIQSTTTNTKATTKANAAFIQAVMCMNCAFLAKSTKFRMEIAFDGLINVRYGATPKTTRSAIKRIFSNGRHFEQEVELVISVILS